MPVNAKNHVSELSGVPLEELFLAISECLPKGWTVTISYTDDFAASSLLYGEAIRAAVREMVAPSALRESTNDGPDS